MKRTVIGIVIGVLAVFGLAACENGQAGTAATKQDQATATQQLTRFQQAQPVPIFNWSQLRQNLIEIETAQSNTTATTSFMFLLAGVGETGPMIHSCPSIGFPIPATYQLSNPMRVEQYDTPGEGGTAIAIPQIEANGVYTGDTTGTYVMCVGKSGKPFAFYHEGYVATVTGPAHWDNARGEIVMDGDSTATFTAKK